MNQRVKYVQEVFQTIFCMRKKHVWCEHDGIIASNSNSDLQGNIATLSMVRWWSKIVMPDLFVLGEVQPLNLLQAKKVRSLIGILLLAITCEVLNDTF